MKGSEDRLKFIGSWQLISWTISYSASDKVTQPFGSSPKGLIVYTHADWMSAAIGRDDRELFATQQSLRSLPPESLARAYSSYFHYAGPFRVEGNTVIHSVTMSLNPNFVGTEQVRYFVFEEDRLTLSGSEIFEDSGNSHSRYHKLLWQRLTDQ